MAPDAGDDSLHVGVNGGTPTTAANLTGFTPNAWSWSRLTMSNTNATLDLSNGGTYTLNVSMREDGLRLDKLMLVTDTVTIPTGQGPLESPTTTVLPNLASHTIQYGYDPLYRLTSATYTGDITATYSYVYDAVGNMSAYTETVGTESSSVNRTFNDANQLLVATDIVSGTTSFYYDGNGNLVQILPPGINPGEADEQLYSFNQRNLLTQYQVGAGSSVYNTVADYIYDGNSNRLQQIDSSGAQPITTTYTNDNAGMSQVLISNNGTTITLNLFGLDLIQQDDGSETRTLLVDGLGSARVEMVGNTIETTTTFEPYGKLLVQSGSSGTTYGYTGEQYDAATSLVYLRARYYNPNLKVFMSRDPFPGYVSDSGSQNGYSYVGNNPVNFIDPSGLYKENVHNDLTYQIALEVMGSKCGGRGSRACVPYLWIAQEIAWANQNMDSVWLMADAGALGPDRTLLHFAQLPRILDNLRRAIARGNPTLFGSALHQYQDYFSHVGEGYTWEHANAENRAACRRGALSRCAVSWGYTAVDGIIQVAEFYGGTYLGRTQTSDFTVGDRSTVENSLSYLGAGSEIANLPDSELIDVWLREQTGPRSAEREHYSYHTDFYYPFTRRDQTMARGTRRWIERFFSGQAHTYPDEYQSCSISSSLPIQGIYERPSNDEIREFLLP